MQPLLNVWTADFVALILNPLFGNKLPTL